MLIRPADESDVEAMLAIRNQSQSTPLTISDWRKRATEARKRGPAGQFVLETSQRMIGFAEWMKHPHAKAGTLFVSVHIDRDERGKGYGTILYQAAKTELDSLHQKFERLETIISDRDPLSKKWAESHGFRLFAHQIESVLRLDRHPSIGNFEQKPFVIDGFQYSPLSDMDRDDMWERVYCFYLELCRDVPDLQNQTLTKADALHFFSPKRGIDADGVWIAQAGKEWVGMTVLRKIHDKEWWNAFTGVRKDYRGLGIAKKLKQLAADYASSKGIPLLRTFNLATNRGMLKINQSLGYIPFWGLWIMEKNSADE